MHFFALLKLRAVSSSFPKKVIIWNAILCAKGNSSENISVPYIGLSFDIQKSNLLPQISKSITSFFLELM